MKKSFFSIQAHQSTAKIQTQAKEIKAHQFNECNICATKVPGFTCKKTQVLTSLFNRVQHEFTRTLLLDSKGDNPYFSTFGDAEIKEGGVEPQQTLKTPPYIQCLYIADPPLFNFGRRTQADFNVNATYITLNTVLHSWSTDVEQGVNPT